MIENNRKQCWFLIGPMQEGFERMDSTEKVLNTMPFIQDLLLIEKRNEFDGYDNQRQVFEIIEATGLEIAALKAKNIEELEKCITYISQNYFGPLCKSEWIAQIIHRFHNSLPWSGEVIFTNILEELSEFYILEDFQELKHN